MRNSRYWPWYTRTGTGGIFIYPPPLYCTHGVHVRTGWYTCTLRTKWRVQGVYGGVPAMKSATKQQGGNIMTTETDFMDSVIDLAHLCGWKVHHSRPAWTAKGYRTPIQGDAGFPDLVLVHEERELLVFAELKAERGKVTPAQKLWLWALQAAGQTVYTWRPSDWDEIVATLR